MRYLKDVAIFATGIGLGYFVAYKSLKKQYEEKFQNELHKNKTSSEDNVKEDGLHDAKEEEVSSVVDIYNPNSTDSKTNYSDYYDKEDDEVTNEDPYTIEYEDYIYDADHENISFTLYSDGTLTDELDELVEFAEEKIGKSNLINFIESDEDEIYIRNEKYGTDYEITKANVPFGGNDM